MTRRNMRDRGQDYRLLFDPSVPWTYDKDGKDAHPEWKGWFRSKDKNGNWAPWEGLTSGRWRGWSRRSVPERVVRPAGCSGPHRAAGRKGAVHRQAERFLRPHAQAEQVERLREPDERAEPSDPVPVQSRRRAVADAEMGAPARDRGLWRQAQRVVRRRRRGADVRLVRPGRQRPRPGVPRRSAFRDLHAAVRQGHAQPRSEILRRRHVRHHGKKQLTGRMSTSNRRRSTASRCNRCWLEYSEIAAGGALDFVLGPNPNKDWGIQ